MQRQHRNRKQARGFTLIELVIVIVILAILAGLAVPRYIRTVNRSRSNEALTILGHLRESAERYYARYQNYSGIASNFSNLDFDPLAISGTASWTYLASGQGLDAYTFTACFTTAPCTAAFADRVDLIKAGSTVTVSGQGQFSGI